MLGLDLFRKARRTYNGLRERANSRPSHLARFPLVFIIGVLAAATARASPLNGSQTYVYRCGNDRIIARHENNAVWLFLPDQTIRLQQVKSDSGATYSSGNITFWTNGETARVETSTRFYENCHNQPTEAIWEDAKLRGVDFRAIGQEPGWVLEIEQKRQIWFSSDYGQTHVSAPASEVIINVDAAQTIYRAQTATHPVLVTITAQPCRDAMSGEPFPVAVTVRLDDRDYHGCGKALH